MPSELLERRPDVRQAEQALAAQTARIGIAEALRFPSLTLTGTLGIASTELSDLADGDSKLWDISGDLFVPLFNSGQNRRRVEVEKARTEQLLNQYEQTILQAFRRLPFSECELRDLQAGLRRIVEPERVVHRPQ